MMKLELRPFDDLMALHVFRNLDVNDQIEAELVRGSSTTAPALWADWRGANVMREASLVAYALSASGANPFAVLGLAGTGQAGVAQAALLAKHHRHNGRALALLGSRVRRELPEICEKSGIHRIEARCWADHPTASGFLQQLGFVHEADLSGFGGDGMAVFQQFAWLKT